MKTGKGLADYAMNKLGMPYFYGSKMNVLTESYMALMHERYPKMVSTSYMKKARDKGQVGKINVDCSGLIYGYRDKNLGSYQLYSTAKKRLPITEVDKFAVGTVLWKEGHVGVYVGAGQVVEARGINYGVVMTPVSAHKWEYGLTFDDMTYTYDEKVEGTSKGVNPYKEPTRTVTSKLNALLCGKNADEYICKGEAVRWVQWELIEAGFDIEEDGSCGRQTLAAIKEFQRSCKLTEDGLCGPATRKALKIA